MVERAGMSIRSLLPGLENEHKCNRQDCVVHTSAGRGNCDQENVVYRGQCMICDENNTKSIYIGETSRSAYVRGLQHRRAIYEPTKHQHNAFARHMIDHHPQKTPAFKIDVINSYKSPLERQISEGVQIANMKCDIILNSKFDHYQPAFNRIIFTNQLPGP